MKFLQTSSLLEISHTRGHRPLKFVCEDLNVYYVKDPSICNDKMPEVHPIFSEVICARLLNALNIPCPELAVVEIVPESVEPQLYIELSNSESKILSLGIREVKNSDLLHDLAPICSLERFKADLNPLDILKIALFDLWVNNCDRGRSGNYNLLTQYTPKGNTYYAFDHAYCFGGIDLYSTGKLPFYSFNIKNRLVNSLFFRNILKYISNDQLQYIVSTTLNLQVSQIKALIENAYLECPDTWNIPLAFKSLIFEFLTDQARIKNIKQVFIYHCKL